MAANTEEKPKQEKPTMGRRHGTEETMSEPAAMAGCPMGKVCGRMMAKPPSALLLMLPGLVLVAIGVAIAALPQILPWIVAGVAVLFGMFMLAMAGFIRRAFARFGGAHT